MASSDVLPPNIDSPCGDNFVYRDFLECSDTWKKTHVENVPKQLETYKSIAYLCSEILDPVWKNFGEVKLTYGFSSPALVKEVKRNPYPNITPNGDQHAGSERNTRGNLICTRQGIAVDFYVGGVNSLEVAKYVVQETRFDRLYFYSPHRPFHVSIGQDESRSIVWMDGYRGGRHQPRLLSIDRFLNMDWNPCFA